MTNDIFINSGYYVNDDTLQSLNWNVIYGSFSWLKGVRLNGRLEN